MIWKGLAALCMALVLAGGVLAQSSGSSPDPQRVERARLDLGGSAIIQTLPRGMFALHRPRALTLRLSVTRPVPYRVFLLDGPPRLVVDFEGLDLSGISPDALFGIEAVPAVRWGRLRNGWSRVVLELPGPYRVDRASLRAKASRPLVEIELEPVSARDFAARPGAAAALHDLPDGDDEPSTPKDEDERLHVVLDPGHGGFDPGALAGDQTEADLVLNVAQALAASLRARSIDVTMTRDSDTFLGLEARMTVARAAGADLFISLHADALPQGEAAGAAVYIWDPKIDEQAARQLAQRHQRDDLLGGLDLHGVDDVLAGALMDVARTDTQPRSENFAKFLASRMSLEGIGMHRRPIRGAGFSVLKSPDIPSVLLELGFISDVRDLANLTDPEWQARMIAAVVDAVAGWANDDQARRALLRH